MILFFTKIEKHAAKFLLPALAAAATLGWLYSVVRAAGQISFRYAYNYAEPVIATVVLNMPRYPLLYPDFRNEPYILNPYNPLFYYLSRAALEVTGAPMASGRLVSFLAGLALCGLIFMILRRLEVGRALAWIVPALCIQIPLVTSQWITMRPDITALTLSLGGLVCFLEYERRGAAGVTAARPGVLYAAGLLLSFLAYFTKQNFLTGAACYFLYLASERRFREAVKFGLIFALVLIVPTLLWNHWTDGLYLLNQQMNAKKPFYGFLLVRLWADFLRHHWPILVLAAAGAMYCFRRGLQRTIGFYFALTLASSIMLGKIGADTNYFLETIVVACLLGGIFFDRVIRLSKHPWSRPAAGATLVALTLWSLSASGVLTSLGPQPSRFDTTEFDRLTAVIEKIEAPIFVENLGLLLAAKKPVLYEPFEFTQMAYSGIWDEQKILGKLDRQEFPLVILETNLWRVARSGRFTPAFVEHLRRSYRPVSKIAGQIICVPAKAE